MVVSPGSRSLVDAVEEQGEAPCDRCRLRDVCARIRTACPDYYRWVLHRADPTGDRFPLRALYQAIFEDGADGAELAPFEMHGVRRTVSSWLARARTTPTAAAELAQIGVNVTRCIRSRANG